MLMLCAIALCTPTEAPTGTFKTECHERHFLLSVKSSFLGSMIRFDIEDHLGLHFLSNQEASDCGYTVLLNHHGDLVLRASFLACYVLNKGDSEYRLRLWFVNRQADGTTAVYPFQLHCSARWPWGTREIVCEENYMEVSLQRPIPSSYSHSQQLKVLDQEPNVGNWTVMFHRPGQSPVENRTQSVKEATALGYHLSQSGSRIILRCLYASPLSYTAKDKGVMLEVVKATILYPLQEIVMAIDTTVACTRNEASVEGPNLLWAVPHVLSPLVQEGFWDRGMRIGLETQSLAEDDLEKRGFQIILRDGVVSVQILFGAQGGHIRSRVIEGRYHQAMSVDLFHMHQWEDHHCPLTQHRSFKFLRTPYLPHKLSLTNNTIPSQRVFSVTLGTFPPDVSLQSVSMGGESLTWTQKHAQNQADLNVSLVSHPNGSHSYRLLTPFSHRHVQHEDVGGGYRTYTLPLTFSLAIYGEVYTHSGTIQSQIQEQTAPEPPRLEGKCTENSILVLLHYGDQEQLWELYLGARRLDWELVKLGGFDVQTEEDFFSVEIPLYSLGLTYEELSLRGYIAMVNISVVNIDTLKVEDHLIHRCTFPVRELLVCLPEGKIVVAVDTMRALPPTQPNRTTLLDPSCVPLETDRSRALFSFSLDSCGTRVKTKGDFLVYENQVRYSHEFLPTDDPLIHRDAPYRMTVRCRYPANGSSEISVQHPVDANFVFTPPPLKHSVGKSPITGKRRVLLDRSTTPAGALGHNDLWIMCTLASMLLVLMVSCLAMAKYRTNKCSRN